MNIFVLHRCPFYSAKLMCDKHVVKMILESAQLLSTAHHLNSSGVLAYKPTHAKHPCTIWAGSTTENYKWLFNHWIGLMSEYHYRYNKIHSCWSLMAELSVNPCKIGPLEPFALAMPDEHKKFESQIECYRSYYRSKPDFIFKYKRRSIPSWLIREST